MTGGLDNPLKIGLESKEERWQAEKVLSQRSSFLVCQCEKPARPLKERGFPSRFFFAFRGQPIRKERTMEFRATRLRELAHPELLTLGGLAAGHLLVRSIDAAAGLNKPFRRVSDWAHLFILGGSAYLYGRGTAPDVTRALFLGDSMLMATSLADLLFERTVAPRVKAIARGKTKEKVGSGLPQPTTSLDLLTQGERSLELGAGQVIPEEGIPVFVDEELAA